MDLLWCPDGDCPLVLRGHRGGYDRRGTDQGWSISVQGSVDDWGLSEGLCQEGRLEEAR